MKPFSFRNGNNPQVLFSFFKFGSVASFLFLSFPSIAQSKTSEQDAVRKAIEQETKLYIEGNYDKWEKTWVHEPTSYWTYSGPDFNNEVIGWDKISAGMKQDMNGRPPLSSEVVARMENKHDYQYKINGNFAHVIYRQGNGNLLTVTMEKQNGEWKLVNETDIGTSSYNFKKSIEALQKFIGKWRYVEGSDSTQGAGPADTNYRQKGMEYDIHETPYGVEFISTSSYTYASQPYTSLVKEDFISNNDKKIISYFDYEKDASNKVSTNIGTASFDTSGRFIVKGMYDDKPTQTRFENIYSFMPDGLLHHEGRSYDDNGKLMSKWFFTLKRL